MTQPHHHPQAGSSSSHMDVRDGGAVGAAPERLHRKHVWLAGLPAVGAHLPRPRPALQARPAAAAALPSLRRQPGTRGENALGPAPPP